MSAKKIFYAAPLCSPARGSSLTGQFSFRFGIPDTHTSGLRVGEIAIDEILKSKGYAMGFFRKRRIDWVQPDEVTSRGDCSPPSHHGFDEAFAKTSAVPTWNPTVTPDGWASNTNKVGEPWKGSFAYMDNGKEATENLESDDSCVVMDRVIHSSSKTKAIHSLRPFGFTLRMNLVLLVSNAKTVRQTWTSSPALLRRDHSDG